MHIYFILQKKRKQPFIGGATQICGLYTNLVYFAISCPFESLRERSYRILVCFASFFRFFRLNQTKILNFIFIF